VRLTGLRGAAHLNGRLGRVLPAGGRGAASEAPAPGRVAVRLAGTGALVLSLRPENLLAAEVRAAPCVVRASRPPPVCLLRDDAALRVELVRRAERCAAFFDVPHPKSAPTALLHVGVSRDGRTRDIPGATVGLLNLSVGAGATRDEAVELLRSGGLATVSQHIRGEALADDEFAYSEASSGLPLSLLLAARAVAATGRATAPHGHWGALPVLRALLPLRSSAAPLPASPMDAFMSGGGMSFATVSMRNNPMMPCAFERLGPPGAAQDRELGGAYTHGRWEMSVEHDFVDWDASGEPHWASRAAAAAASKARIALMQPPEEAAATADAALALCGACGDAWSARALRCAGSHEEALAHFRRGVAAAKEALAPELLQELRECAGLSVGTRAAHTMRELWMVHPVRPLVRAMAGVANALRKLGRWAEAADAYEALHVLDPGTHVTSSPWLNWKVHVPLTLLAAGRAARCREYLRDADNEACLTYNSSNLHWQGAGALLDYVTHFAPGVKPQKKPGLTWPGEHLARMLSSGSTASFSDLSCGFGAPGDAAMLFVSRYPQALVYLFDDAMAPAGAVSAMLAGDSDAPANMACWAHAAAPAWRSVPGAWDWLRRMHATLRVRDMLSEENLIKMHTSPAVGPVAPPLPPLTPAAACAAIAAGDVYVQARFGSGFCQSLLQLAAAGSRCDVAVLKALLARGARTADDTPTPLQMWSYYAGDASIGKALLAAGDEGTSREPLAEACRMAAEQCNAAHLAELLAVIESDGERQYIAPVLLEACTHSSVAPCIASRGADACHRCLHGDRPHAPSASLARTLGVFASFGLMAHARRQGVTAAAAAALRRWEATQAGRQRGDASCELCGEAPAHKRCSRCRGARFCGAECMRAAWPTHKRACQPRA
jgi:tetratricopeptide (TPR) repeat protein